MKKLLIATLFTFQIIRPAVAETSVELPNLEKFELPNDFISVPENAISKRYADTSCISIAKRRAKKPIGLICTSANREFVRDMGIHSERTAPQTNEIDSANEKSAFTVSSAISKYAMNSFVSSSGLEVYSARVDCDEAVGAIYRPTATCHIAFATPKQNLFIYSNFTLTNHTSGVQRIHESDIRSIWSSIQIVPRP